MFSPHFLSFCLSEMFLSVIVAAQFIKCKVSSFAQLSSSLLRFLVVVIVVVCEFDPTVINGVH